MELDFLVVWWLRLHASTAGHAGSIPGWGTKIFHVEWCDKKIIMEDFEELGTLPHHALAPLSSITWVVSLQLPARLRVWSRWTQKTIRKKKDLSILVIK